MPVKPQSGPAPTDPAEPQQGPHPSPSNTRDEKAPQAPASAPTSSTQQTVYVQQAGPQPSQREIVAERSYGNVPTPQDRLLSIYENSDRVKQLQDALGNVPETQRYAPWQLVQDLDAVVSEVGNAGLPPEVALAVAQMDLYESDKRKASRLLAQEYALPLKMVVPRAKDKKGIFHWIDPTSGQEISLATARRISPHLEASVIYRQLASTPGGYHTTPLGPHEQGRETVPDKTPIDPIWTAAGVAVLSKHFGDDLSYRDAMSAAIGMAQTQTDLNLFDQNLTDILGNGVGDGQAAIALAHTAALSGVRIQNRADALRFIASADARTLDQSTLEEAIRDAEEISKTSEEEVGPWLTAQGVTGEQLEQDRVALASESIRKTYDYIYGGQPVKQALREYKKISSDILDTIQQEDYDNEHSLVGKWLGRAGGVYEEIAKPFRGVAANLISNMDYIYANTWGAAMWEDYDQKKIEQEFQGNLLESEEIFGGKRDLTEWLINDRGYEPWQAMVTDLIATWYADPLIVGGKLLHVTRAAKYFQFSKLYEGEMGAVRWINYVDKVVDKPFIRLGWKSPAKFTYEKVIESLDRISSSVPTVNIDPNTGVATTAFKNTDEIAVAVTSDNVPLWALDQGDFYAVYERAKKVVTAAGGVDNLPRSNVYRRAWMKLQDVPVPNANAEDMLLQHLAKSDAVVGNFQDRLLSAFQQRWTGQGIDPFFMNYVFDYVKANRAARTEAELIGDISDFWKVSLGAKPADGTAAFDFLKSFHDDVARRTAGQLDLASDSRTEWTVAKAMQQQDTEDALFQDFLNGYGSSHQSGNIMHYAPRPTVRGMTRRATRVLPGADTRVARATRATFNRMAGNVVDLERNLSLQTERILTRSREFSRNEIRALALKAQRIADPKNPQRVEQFQAFVKEIQRKIIVREAQNLGIEERLAMDIADIHLTKAQEASDNLFGAGREGLVEDAIGAQLETQLRNRLVMIDPVQVRRTLHEMVSYRKSVLQWGRRFAPGLDPKQYDVHALIKATRYSKETGELLRETNDVGKVIDTWQRARDAYLRIWKPMVVITPRYILRVPLGDETLRYFSDLSVWSRFKNSALGSRLGVAHPTQFEFTLDITRTNQVVGDVRNAGFESVEEAIDVIARSKSPKLPVDPRIRDLSPNVRGWLDGAVVNGDQGVFGTLAVDANGAPLTLQHGSTVRFSAADKQFGSNIDPKNPIYNGKGFYFSTSVDNARNLRRGSSRAGLSEVQLHVTRPVMYDGRLNSKIRMQLQNYAIANPSEFKGGYQGFVDHLNGRWKDPNTGNTFYNVLTPGDIDFAAFYKGDVNQLWENLGFDSVRRMDGNAQNWIVFDPANIVNGVPENQLQISVKLEIPKAYDIVDDPAVASGVRYSEIYETMSQLSRRQAKEAKLNWQRLNIHDVGEVKFSEGWGHVLNNQYARSPMGRRVLERIARGAQPEDITDDVLDWLRNHPDGKVTFEQLGFTDINPAMVDEAIRARVAHIYKDTLGDAAIASKALKHEATGKWLAGYMTARSGAKQGFLKRGTNKAWWDDAPVIHSLDAERAAGLKYEAGVIVDNVGRAILELPTNHLVRHPFARDWYNRARTQMLNLAKANGTELTDSVMRSIEAEARIFAQHKVKDVMFDFKESSRIAEMMGFVAPFMQPFMEAFMVWGRLIADKPQLLGYATHIWSEVSKDENGIVTTDPFSGEKYINMGWMGPAWVLNQFFPGGRDFPGWSITGNVANINMFMSSTLELDTYEWTGGLLPDISAPIPGFSTPVHWVMQKLAESDVLPPSMKWKAVDYAMQFGSTDWTSTLPMWMRNWAASTGLIKDDVVKSYAIDFIKMDALAGVTPQSIARAQHISIDEAKVRLAESAENRARDLFGWRAVFSLLLPTAPRIDMPTRDLENEYLSYLQGNSTEEALKLLKKNNPGVRNLETFTAASTYWAGTRDAAAYYDSGAVPIPANRAIDMLLDDPKFREYAKQNPQLAFMMIPDEFWELGFDRESYFAQVDKGWRVVSDPIEFLNDVDVQEGYAQYRALTDSWNNAREWYDIKGINTANPSYKAGVGQHMGYDDYLAQIDRIQQQHPAFARYGAYRESLGVDIQHDIKWKEVLQNPAIKGTDLGQAVSQWIKGRDRIIEDMQKDNIYGVEAPGWYELGYDQRVEQLKAEVMNEHPGFSRAYYTFFDEEFTKIDGLAWQEEAARIEAAGKGDEVFKWQREYNQALDKAKNAIDDADAVKWYIRARQLSVQAGFMDINPQESWWNMTDEMSKRSLKMSTRFRPFGFMSEFDRGTILGMKTDDAAEDAWIQIGLWDARIAKMGDDFPLASRKEMYASRDATVRQLMASSKTFKQQVEDANKWGFPFFFENKWLEGDNPSNMAWRAFRGSLYNMQAQADAKDMVGDNDFDDQRGALYVSMRNTMEDYVKNTLFEYSPSFKRQWYQASEEYGGRLMEYFMPEWYFPLGGHEYN